MHLHLFLGDIPTNLVGCDIVCSCLSKSINNESTDSLNFFDWNRSNNQIFLNILKPIDFNWWFILLSLIH